MKPGDNIFVYGTLKEGHGANSLLQGRANYVGETRISGKMYSLGGFPGIKEANPEFLSEGPTVRGELYRIEDERLPEMLDGYEGYPRLYDRTVVRCENGEEAWTYTYNGEPREEALVPTGCWE